MYAWPLSCLLVLLWMITKFQTVFFSREVGFWEPLLDDKQVNSGQCRTLWSWFCYNLSSSVSNSPHIAQLSMPDLPLKMQQSHSNRKTWSHLDCKSRSVMIKSCALCFGLMARGRLWLFVQSQRMHYLNFMESMLSCKQLGHATRRALTIVSACRRSIGAISKRGSETTMQ